MALCDARRNKLTKKKEYIIITATLDERRTPRRVGRDRDLMRHISPARALLQASFDGGEQVDVMVRYLTGTPIHG